MATAGTASAERKASRIVVLILPPLHQATAPHPRPRTPKVSLAGLPRRLIEMPLCVERPSVTRRLPRKPGSVRGPVAGLLIGDRDHDPYFVAGRRVAARSPIFRP